MKITIIEALRRALVRTKDYTDRKLENKEDTSNKVSSFGEGSVVKYPTTSAVVDYIQDVVAPVVDDKESASNKVNSIGTGSTIKYPTTKAVLDHASAGTWTPTANGVDVTAAKGEYMRVGKMVVISFYVQGTSLLSQNIYIKGASLPFAPSTSAANYSGGGAMSGGYFPENSVFVGYRMVASNGNVIPVKHNGANTDGKRALSVISSRGDETETVQMTGTLMYMSV